MKAHNLEAIGRLTLSYEPTRPDDAVRLRDLESMVATSQPVFITNVEAIGGNSGNKQYADTIPPNQVLLSVATDKPNIRVHFLAESPYSFYNPTVEVDGGPADSLTEVPNDRRMYQGYRDIVLEESRTVTVVSSTGATASVEVSLEVEGPAITELTVVSLPEGQTAVKSGDLIAVQGVVGNSAIAISVSNAGAAVNSTMTIGEADSAGVGRRTFTGNVVASNRTGNLPITATARNSLGTSGASFNSANVPMDQTVPSIVATVAYDNGHSALAIDDTATVNVTITGQSSQTFAFSHGTFSGDANAYLTTRTITAKSALYSLTGGITITAHRSANGASRTSNFNVSIASVLATAAITIVGATTRNEAVNTGSVVSDYPFYGASATAINSEAAIEAMAGKFTTTQNQQFTVNPSASQFGWFAYPKALGLATFVNTSSGLSGGWDGASWPIDGSIGENFGPVEVTKDGVAWYVYRTDFQGPAGTFNVTFANPGLPVGTGGSATNVSAFALRTSPAGTVYNVRVTANQNIDVAPQLDVTAGTWDGAWSKVSNTVWQRSLRVRDSDPRGVAQFTNLVLENLAGLETTEITSGAYYTLRGFSMRVITFPAFARFAPIGANVSDASKTVARYAGTGSNLTLRTNIDTAAASYTIVDEDGNYAPAGGTHLWLSDANFAASNTSGTLQVEIEETL